MFGFRGSRFPRVRSWVERTVVFALPVLALLTMAAPAARGADITPAQALERFLTAEEIQVDWFAQSFLNAVPFVQLEPIRTEMTGSLGAFEEIRPDGDRWLAVYETGLLPCYVILDAEGRFTGLRMLMPIARVTDLSEVVASLRGLPGRTGLLVTRDGETLAELEPDTPLAVGSVFKLSVLDALRDQVESGMRHWSDVVELDAEGRSLPSGILQRWPADSPVTLHTLAVLMISISDNTATDVLIRLLGRDSVEALAPERNRPFLTTAEMFRLKAPSREAARTRYREGAESDRRAVLEEIADDPLPGADLFAGDPVAIDIEWFYSAREVRALLDRTAGLDLMTVNPGVANAAKWERITYKGGSEPGVLSMATRLEASDGSVFCVVLTRNDPDAAIDETEFTRLYTGILDALGAGD